MNEGRGMMRKLVDCPLCGQLPDLCEENSFIDDNNQWWAGCHNKAHQPLDVGPCNNVEDVIWAWNQRIESMGEAAK